MPDDKKSHMTTLAERNAELFRDGFTLEQALRRKRTIARDTGRPIGTADEAIQRNGSIWNDDDYVIEKR